MTTVTELRDIALAKLEDLAPSTQRIAVCQYGPSVYARPDSYKGQDILVISEDFANGLRAHRRVTDGHEIRFLISDRNLLESDVQRGTLGDFLTEKFLYPHYSLSNGEYLENTSIQAKTRAVKEEARELVVEYGEMCRGIAAKPEFFGLSRMRKQARVFVPSMGDYLRFLDPSVRERNVGILRESFKTAISAMKGEVCEFDGIKVDSEHNESRASGIVGAGGPKLQISNYGGNIEIRKSSMAALPAPPTPPAPPAPPPAPPARSRAH